MKFIISRSSHHWDDELEMEQKPCDNAKLETIPGIDDYDDRVWTIEVKTLEEFVQFQKTVGHPVILRPRVLSNSYPELEIYDDYRE